MLDRVKRLILNRPRPVRDAVERWKFKAFVGLVAGGFAAGVAAVVVLKILGG
jgi:hypothetical protein